MAREKLATAAIITCMVAAVSMLPALAIFGNVNRPIGTISDINPSVASISQPQDKEYVVGTSGNTISWTITGGGGSGQYWISRDGNEIDWGNWLNGNPIIVNVDGLSIGTYHYSILVYDSSDGSNSNGGLYVTVTENYQLEYIIILTSTFVVLVIFICIIIGIYRYQRSPAEMARKARRSEILKQEGDRRVAKAMAAQKAREELERREREIKEKLARLERERAEQAEREKREAEEAKMRDLFKKFMAEEQGKTVADVDKMFDEWKNKKEKI